MSVNIVNDLAVLSTVPEKILNKMFKKMVYCICEAVEEDLLDNKEITELDIGIGTLFIKHDETASNIKYHFEASNYLEKALKDTILNKRNLLEDVLNDSLVEKFKEVYKDIC